jgi:hypothetical protein
LIATILSTICEWLKELFSFASHLFTWHPFGVLALLPGLIALFNLIALSQSFDKTKVEADKLAERKEKEDEKDKTKKVSRVFVETWKSLEAYRPRLIYTLLGALCLTAVFEIVAAIGGTGALSQSDLGVAGVHPHRSNAASEGELVPAPRGEKLVKIGAAPGGTERGSDEQSRSESPSTISGLAGLVYAGYGAYIYTLILVISRLNSSALTGQFLAVSSVRSAIALVLGFAAADTNIFSGLTGHQGLFILFFIGLFPAWAMDAVRRRAQNLFKARDVGCDVLPLCLIDGLDDGIGDRLAELGVWDIQHIAASDPVVLAAKSLYPIRRVVDWMDQALLISYVRGQISHFRSVGVRGAIDFALLYSDAMGFDSEIEDLNNPEDQAAYRKKLADRAAEIFKVLAQKTGLSEASLNAIGRSLYEDAVVNFIWDLWFHADKPADDTPQSDASASVTGGPPPLAAPSGQAAPPPPTEPAAQPDSSVPPAPKSPG